MTAVAPLPVLTLAERLAAAVREGLEPNAKRWLKFAGVKSGDVVELQALDVPSAVRSTFLENHCAQARDAAAVLRLVSEATAWRSKGPGVYVLVNAPDPRVVARGKPDAWRVMRGNKGTKDHDILARRAFFTDVDSDRPSDISGTDAEVALTHEVAERIFDTYSELLGGTNALAFGDSGNGRSLFVALDMLPNTDAVEALVKGCLAAVKAVFERPGVVLDTSVSDAKRLAPAFGTIKRKGDPDNAERPHRPTGLLVPDVVRRLSLEEFRAFHDGLLALVPEDQRATVEKQAGRKPSVAKTVPKTDPSDESPFKRANACDIETVCRKLGLFDSGELRCPGCGTVAHSSVALVGGGLKCMHATCAHRGVKPGFRTPVDLVCEVLRVEPKEAIGWFVENFGIDGFPEKKTKRKAKRPSDDQAPQSGRQGCGDDHRLLIRISSELYENTSAASDAIRGDGTLFQRDGRLVNVVRVDSDREGGVAWVPGTPQIREVAAATLAERLTTVARFEKFDKREGDWVPALPSGPIINGLHARGEWDGVRPLVGILEAPSFGPDGTIIARPGYDDRTGYLLIPNRTFPPVPTRPSEADARGAFGLLREVFEDFPFKSAAGLEVAVSALLTLQARPMIQGAVPAHLFDASTPGSGKSLQTDAIAIIATGRDAPRMNWPPSEEELEKVLAAYALRGATLVSFDNIARPFCGAPLDRCITATDRVELRVLGKTEVPALRWRAVVVGTGNNIAIEGDTMRRVLISRLVPDREDPENRAVEEFKHAPLLDWVRQERGRLVCAGLTMIAGWLSAGRPQLAKGTWGSFDNWAAVVPQVIAFAGGANLHEARPKRGEGHDSETSAVLAVMGAIAALCRNAEIAGIKLAELIKRLYPVRDRREPPPPADGYDDARGAIESLVYVKPGFPPDAKALGKALRKYKGRIIGGRQLNAVTGHADTLLWSVADLVEAEGSEGSEGIPQAHAGKVSKYNSGVEYDSLGDSAMGQASKASQPSETETTGGAR